MAAIIFKCVVVLIYQYDIKNIYSMSIMPTNSCQHTYIFIYLSYSVIIATKKMFAITHIDLH